MSITVDPLRDTLDGFLQRVDVDCSLLADGEFIRELLEVLLLVRWNEKSLVDHRVLVILRDCYLKLLHSWRDGQTFDATWGFVFENIAHFFLKLVSHLPASDVAPLKDLLFHADLLHEINAFLKRLSINGEFLLTPHLQSVDDLLRTLERLERHQSLSISPFAESIVQCLCSSTFIETFPQLKESVGHRFLFSTCVDYLVSHSREKEGFLRIRQSLLRPFTQWLTDQSTYFRLWTTPLILLVRQLSFLLTLTIQNDRSSTLDSETFADFSRLIDSFVNILFSVVQSDPSANTLKLAQTWLATIVPNLYTLILSAQLEKYLREKHVTALILKLVENDNEEIQLNAWRILSSILTDYETKHSVDVKRLIELLGGAMEKTIDQPLRFHHFLRCLKNLIRYDSIKDHWIEQDLLRFLLRSVHSAEILLELTFHPEASRQMKNKVNDIRELFASSGHHSVMIDHLLWRLEEQPRRVRREEKVSRYDLLFISSPVDVEICQRLFEDLRGENYRISFDHQEMKMSDKAELIDQSESIVICMSEALKHDPICRSEVSYVLDNHSHFIPLIVSSTYRPTTGWLNTLIQGKVYIDWVKLDFHLAMNKLKNELQRKPLEEREICSSAYPAMIDQWTNEQVKRFASSKDFSSLLPILSQMNGALLRQLALMCLANRESMFHTLRKELNNATSPLTLIAYLRFLNEIETYLPSS